MWLYAENNQAAIRTQDKWVCKVSLQPLFERTTQGGGDPATDFR